MSFYMASGMWFPDPLPGVAFELSMNATRLVFGFLQLTRFWRTRPYALFNCGAQRVSDLCSASRDFMDMSDQTLLE